MLRYILPPILLLPPAPYEVPTHQAISLLAAQSSTGLRRELDEFGWAKLTHSNAETALLDKQVKSFLNPQVNAKGSTPIELIGKGSIVEDYSTTFSTWRFLNHFLDGLTQEGLSLFQIPVGSPSNVWGCCHTGNEYRWQEALDAYRDCLILPDVKSRDSARVELFRSLGQVIHLIQDAYQPSHSRNDSHSHLVPLQGILDGFSELELWADDHFNPFGLDAQVKSGLFSGVPFEGTLDDYFFNASTFSNRYFFSDSTIWFNLPIYADPSDSNTQGGTEALTIAGLFDVDVHYRYSSTITNPDGSPMRLAHRKHSLLDLFDVTNDPSLLYTLSSPNDVVVRDNASVLIGQAMAASTGVLDFFFRGDLALSLDSSGPMTQLLVTNASSAPGTTASDLPFGGGELDLVYLTESGDVLPVPGFSNLSLSAMQVGVGQLLSGDIIAAMNSVSDPLLPDSTRAVPNRTVYAVYDGTIGLERGIAASSIDVTSFQIVDFDGPDFIYDAGQPDPLVFTWAGNPTFPVTFHWDKQVCNSAFWNDCHEDEAFTWNAQGNPLVLTISITGCANTTELIQGEVWLEDANGVETNRMPWDVAGVFLGSQCLGPNKGPVPITGSIAVGK